MKSERVWYGFDNEHEKRRGAWINSTDIEILTLIWTNRYLTSKQLTKYGNQLFGYKGDSIQKKLKRWSSYSIVRIEYQSVLNKPPLACYYLGRNGYSILLQEGIIEKEDSTFNINTYIKNAAHYLGIQDIVIDSLISTKTLRRNITSLHPNRNTFKDKSDVTIIVPDWIFKLNNRTLHIEYDTGTQNLRKIKDKIRDYIKLSEYYPDEEHYVLISVADNSNMYTVKYFDDRKTRVLNIKEAILEQNINKNSNLNFFVTTASRSHVIANNILKSSYPFSLKTIESETELFELSLNISNAPYRLIPLQLNDVYSDNNHIFFKNSSFYQLLHSSNKEIQKTMILSFMEEGNVTALKNINFLNDMKKQNMYKLNVDFILAVYQSKTELENDILMRSIEGITLTDTKNWPNIFKGTEEQTPILKRKVGKVLERIQSPS